MKEFISQNVAKFGLWVRPIAKTLYLMPPLNVEIEDLELATEKFELYCKNFIKL